MKSTITIILSCFVLCTTHFVYSQNPQTINLSIYDTGSKTYKAQDQITFSPGYKYTGTTNSMQAYIEKHTQYQDLLSSTTFNNSTVNTNLEVGTLQGAGDVSASGGATYSISLPLPYGTNGLMPSLGIAYNSQSGNGHLGNGWNLTGLSSISVVPKSFQQDGVNETVNISGDNVFALDGNRLHIATGTYGSNGATYLTELETFVRVTSYGSGTNPDWFQVETKEGLILEFGNSNDSKIKSTSTSIGLSWRINKISDLFGNKIEYIYINNPSDSRISRIKYSGNDDQGTATVNAIEFTYTTRDDKNTTYSSGNSFQLDHLLSKIEIFSESQLFRKFDFSYGMNNISFLKSISESGSGGISYNPTIFKYGDSNPASVSIVNSNLNSSDIVAQGDYDGDGITDLVTTYYVGSTQFWRIHKSNGDGTFSEYRSGQMPVGTFQVWNWREQNSTIPGAVSTFDFFGDGRDDLILFSVNANDNLTIPVDYIISELVVVDIFEPTSALPQGFRNVSVSSLVTGGYIHPNKFLQIGDFDGDGKDDLLFLRYNSSSNLSYSGKLIRSSSNSIQGGSKTSFDLNTSSVNVNLSAGLQWLGSSTNFKIIPTSFNGSGKHQLMVKFDNSCEIFILNKNTGNNDYSDSRIYFGSTDRFTKLQGDFNGDGLLDGIKPTTTFDPNPIVTKSICTGTSYLTEPFSPSYSIFDGASYTGDFNGDGKMDIFQSVNINNQFISTIFFISNGNSFIPYEFNQITFLDFPKIFGDFNGDGKTDLFCNDKVYSLNPNEKGLILDKVKNGLGQEIAFNYQYMSKNVNYTKTDVNERFPINTFQTSIPLVENVSTSDGVGGIATTSYSYEGAKLHRQGKGFLGFMKTTVSSETSGTTVTMENELFPTSVPTYPALAFQSIPYLLVTKKQKVILNSNSSLISESIATNNLISNGVKYKVQVSQSVSSNALNSSSTTTSMTYDSFGNNLQTITNNGVETTTTTNVFGTFGSWWIPSVATQVTVNNLRTGQTAFERKKNFTYTTKGKVNTEITDQGTPKAVTLSYLYDNFGNSTRVTTSSPGLPSVIAKVEYDSKGRFIVKTINTLNQEQTYIRSSKWGSPTSKTDIIGNTMLFSYNELGQLLTTTDALGNVVSSSTQWDIMTGGSGASTPNNTLFKTVTSVTNGSTDKVWFDNLGRQVKSETEGLSGNPIVVQKFLPNGNIASTTSPFFAGDTPVITNYSYDEYQRPISTTNGISTSTNSYSTTSGNYSITTTTPLGTTSKTTDPSGKVISSQDEGGTLQFAYYSSGKQKTVSLGNDILVSMEYDQYARQTKLIDKNAGETNYIYNGYGQLISQTDANNNLIQLVYDNMGRQTSKTGVDGVTTSTYITSGNGLNQLKKITAPNGVFTEFTYDNFNRVITEVKNIDGITYNSSFEYDAVGRASTYTYPSGFKIRYYYDSRSNLISIKNNAGSITYYSSAVENAFGQNTQYLMGNGKTTTNFFTNLGQLSTTFTSGVQNLQTLFDPSTGHLLNRRDNLKNRIETFTYDGNNRLLDATVVIPGNPSVLNYLATDYTANGNISDKSDAGSYSYDANKINAVTHVSNDISLIPTQTQSISYTTFDRTASIDEGSYHIDFTYGPEQDRVKTVLKNAGVTIKTKYFVGLYEKEVTPSGTKEINYIPTPGGEVACVTDNGVSSTYYLYTDHLGSPVAVTNATGTVLIEQNFDAWGRRRNKNDWTYNSVAAQPAQFSWLRGYTGHEHLDEFGVINMNNRMYDPLLARMLAVDNFIQNPFSTQAYNRYSYVGNNPLSYTDPSGEIAGFVWQAGWTLGGTIGNIIGGVDKPFQTAFNSSRGYMAAVNAASSHSLFSNANNSVSASINYNGLGISLNYSGSNGNLRYGASVGYGLLSGPFASASFGYNNGKTALGISGGAGKNYAGWGASASYYGYGLSYGETHYGNEIGPDGNANKQTVGSFGILFPGGSVSHMNDFHLKGLGGDGEDRWRTAAMQLNIGNFSAGWNVYTNEQSKNTPEFVDPDGENMKGQTNLPYSDKYIKAHNLENTPALGAWRFGQVYSANAWIGWSQGGFTNRISYSHPAVQDKTQNNLHRNGPDGSKTHLFNCYDEFKSGFSGYTGYHNPFSQWW